MSHFFKRFSYFLCITLFLFSQSVLAISDCQITHKTINTILPKLLHQHNTPSAAIAVLEAGELCMQVVHGQQDNDKAASEKTLYNIASLTKPITSEVILSLIDQQKMKIHDKVAEFYIDPDIANDKWVKDLTLNHLISHQSGFPNWRYQTNDKLVIRFEPGSAPAYSGEGYQYMAKYAEKRLSKSFIRLAHEHVFDSLNMNNTYFRPPIERLGDIAYPYDKNKEIGKPSIQSTYNAADDIYTSIEDFALFAQYVLVTNASKQAQESKRWDLTHNLAERVCSSGRLKKEDCPKELGFVSGWSKLAYEDAVFYLQGGGDWGEKAMVILDLEHQKAAVIFTNGANGMNVVHDLIDTVFSHPQLSAFIKMQAGA